jgi:archaellum biogenesis ATPase FlaH
MAGLVEGRGRISVLVIPEQKYASNMIDVLRSLAGKYNYICYVSLNKPSSSLLSILKENSIDTKKFYFIDAITRTAAIPLPVDYCTYVSSPGALTEISLAISNMFNNKNVDCILFDSLSTLFIHESEATITKFVHFLMAKLKVIGCDSFFTILKGDENSAMIKDIHMFADQVLDISKWG